MLLKILFAWFLLHSFDDSVHDIFEVTVQNITSLENLEDQLKENCTFSIVDSNAWFNTKESLVSHSDQHLDSTRLLHEFLRAIDQVAIDSLKKCTISKSILILHKDLFQGTKYFTNNFADLACFLDEVLDNIQNTVFKVDFGWVYHKLKNRNEESFEISGILGHQNFFLSNMDEDVDTLLTEDIGASARFLALKLYSRNYCLCNKSNLILHYIEVC